MTKQNNDFSVIQEHDKFFREIMQDMRVARDFVKAHLPQDVLTAIDLDYLELQPRTLTDETRRESAVDVLFKTRIDGQEGYLFILAEHQSVPDPLMPFRIIHYTCKVIARHLRQQKSQGKDTSRIPLVYPIVVYHGKRPWKYSRDIRDIVGAPRELVDRYFLQPFQLLDLGKIEDETLREHVWSGVAEFLMKHIHAADILPYIREMADIMHQLTLNGGRQYVEILLQYSFSKGEIQDDSAFFDLIRTRVSPEIGDKVMGLAQRIRQDTWQEAQLEYALRMLQEGAEPAFVAKITKLPIEKINELVTSSATNDDFHE